MTGQLGALRGGFGVALVVAAVCCSSVQLPPARESAPLDPCPGVADAVEKTCGCNPVDTRLAVKVAALSQQARTAARTCGGFGVAVAAQGVAVGNGTFWQCVSEETKNDPDVVAALRSVLEQAPSDVSAAVMEAWVECYQDTVRRSQNASRQPRGIEAFLLGKLSEGDLSPEERQQYLQHSTLLEAVRTLAESKRISGDRVIEYLKLGSVSAITKQFANERAVTESEKASVITRVRAKASEDSANVLRDLASTYGLRAYGLASDTSLCRSCRLDTEDRPLYLLDTDPLPGEPSDASAALRMYAGYTALQQGDGQALLQRKLALLRGANVVKRMTIWVPTDIAEPSQVRSYQATPKVMLRIDRVTVEFQRQLDRVDIQGGHSRSDTG